MRSPRAIRRSRADPDRDAAQHSHVWDAALDPQRRPYELLIRDARRLLDEHGKDTATAAIAKLDDAIARLPRDPRAYALRGDAYLTLKEWAPCADDLAAADDRTPSSTTSSAERDRQQLELGICQGRAGRLTDAERTLARAVIAAPRGDQWMRLGEVRIALGKLDEAIDALHAAIDANDGQQALIRWLLATAYDRSRRITEAEHQATIAYGWDQSFSTIVNTPYPLLGPGESDYLLGLAYGAANPPSPEYALLYFRHFLKIAPDSPWRRRANEHVRDLKPQDWPQTLRRHAVGGALLDLPTARLAIEKSMPALRACVAAAPFSAYSVTVTRTGPHAPEPGRDHPRFTVPAAEVKAETTDNLEPVPATTDATIKRCLEGVAERIAMPAIKEHDVGGYRLTFVRRAVGSDSVFGPEPEASRRLGNSSW